MFSSSTDSSNTPRLLCEFRVSVCPEEYSHINLHDAPSAVVQVIPNRLGGLFSAPLWPVAVGAVVKIRLKDRLQDELHRRLHHAIFHRRDAERSCPPFRLGNLDDPYRCELVVLRAQYLVEFVYHL